MSLSGFHSQKIRTCNLYEILKSNRKILYVLKSHRLFTLVRHILSFYTNVILLLNLKPFVDNFNTVFVLFMFLILRRN